MDKRIRTARLIQLAGAACLVVGVAQVGLGEPHFGGWLLLGLLLVIGARLYEWLRRE